MLALVVAALVVAFTASVVVFGYPALIAGALAGVALSFVIILALTAEGMFSRKGDESH
jgi:hypothetical protein